ncbi:sensor domain-containing diguanylate cyclase [Marinomonas pollencensis]|uniref:diguanylate cyclase n=1 Tax=Marinomonas pollencensis TaxID=491954 RepID=A0A3E0DQ13_9GAMM|nr:sensor domain-containing diguanylate cyclase [Marinomonas pollencensis]REG85046.1 diguanylate cyclase (GGDEF)-like protein [Marinomonas pollencensis]
MEDSNDFLRLILDSIAESIAVIDELGDIRFVNHSWSQFGSDNECAAAQDWSQVNYLSVCDGAALAGDEFGALAGAGIKSVIDQTEAYFNLEYPCHSDNEQRWFIMRVSPFSLNKEHFFVISHQDVTERKLAEKAVEKLARRDGLTNIYNRRAFDEILNEQWLQCLSVKQPISLAVIDLDHFKLLNDTYGHQTGDDCLIAVSALLKNFARRTGDVCARYGGEEFAVIWSYTTLLEAQSLSQALLEEIRQLRIPNERSPIVPYMTASIGLVEMTPNRILETRDLIAQADDLLYQAKESGRNKVSSLIVIPSTAIQGQN